MYLVLSANKQENALGIVETMHERLVNLGFEQYVIKSRPDKLKKLWQAFSNIFKKTKESESLTLHYVSIKKTTERSYIG